MVPHPRKGTPSTTQTAETQYFASVVLDQLPAIFEAIVSGGARADVSRAVDEFDPIQLKNYVQKRLHHTISIASTTEAVWEVDENCNGKISWDEFSTAMTRCLHDAHAREPQQVFNVVLFSVFSGSDGIISEQQLKKLLYLRFGTSSIEDKLVAGFGKDGPYCVGFDAFIRGMSLVL